MIGDNMKCYQLPAEECDNENMEKCKTCDFPCLCLCLKNKLQKELAIGNQNKENKA